MSALLFSEILKYRDDEPRDDHGRWTSSGGGGSDAHVDPKHAASIRGKVGQARDPMAVIHLTEHEKDWLSHNGHPIYRNRPKNFDTDPSLVWTRTSSFLQHVLNEYDGVSVAKYSDDEARDDHGRWTSGGGGGDGSGREFVSPNISDLTFREAAVALHGERHAAMLAASADVDRVLGMATARTDGVVGAWTDGAENSLMTEVHNASWDRLKLAAAMKGHLADQKAVLIFHADPKGSATLAEFHASGDLTTIHQGLLADGLANHTLVPEHGGARVVAVAFDASDHAAITKGAARYGSGINATAGRAEFIGAPAGASGTDREVRDAARGEYDRIISSVGSDRDRAQWDRLHNRWGQALEGLRKYDPEEARDDHGRWTTGGGGADVPRGTGRYTPGVKAHGTGEAEARKAAWAKRSPLQTVDAVLAEGPRAQHELIAGLRQVEAETGAKLKDPGWKGKPRRGGDPDAGIKRIKEKIAAGRDPAAVSDIVRSGFVVSHPGDADKVIGAIGKRFEVAAEDWKRTPLNYIDRQLTVRLPSGMLAEVQISDPHMSWAKSPDGGGGHTLYTASRSLPNGPRQAALNEQQRALYGGVIDRYPAEWKAALGRLGKFGKALWNSLSKTMRAFMPTSAALIDRHSPLTNHHASSMRQRAGLPSNTAKTMGSAMSTIWERSLAAVKGLGGGIDDDYDPRHSLGPVSDEAMTFKVANSLPRPQDYERRAAFVSRFMADVSATHEFPDSKHRAAVADRQFARFANVEPRITTKDLSVGDVHVGTAIGNSGDAKRRARLFSAFVGKPCVDDLLPTVIATHKNVSRETFSDEGIVIKVAGADPDQQLIFGWASVVEKDGEPIIDKQGDIIPVAELENAAYDFVVNSRQHGDMHRKIGTGHLVESMVFTREKQAALGVDLGHVGWWIGMRVTDPGVWARHKAGELPEFSIGGTAFPETIGNA